MDLPVSTDCSVASGVSTPWLMALFRKSTLAGSISIEVRNSTLLLMRNSTALPAIRMNAVMTGVSQNMEAMAARAAKIPAEKLSTSISKPGLILPAHRPSSFFMHQAARGPQIMAPRNIGEPLPSSPIKTGEEVPSTTPMVAMAPTTPPRIS